MITKQVTYIDYNDAERTERFYFNLSPAELLEMEMSTPGGFSEMMNAASSSQDPPTLIRLFKDLVLKAYGEKSLDGKRFIKTPEIATAFSQTEAYSEIFMELATNDVAASDFVNGIMPSKEKMEKFMKKSEANAENAKTTSQSEIPAIPDIAPPSN